MIVVAGPQSGARRPACAGVTAIDRPAWPVAGPARVVTPRKPYSTSSPLRRTSDDPAEVLVGGDRVPRADLVPPGDRRRGRQADHLAVEVEQHPAGQPGVQPAAPFRRGELEVVLQQRAVLGRSAARRLIAPASCREPVCRTLAMLPKAALGWSSAERRGVRVGHQHAELAVKTVALLPRGRAVRTSANLIACSFGGGSMSFSTARSLRASAAWMSA